MAGISDEPTRPLVEDDSDEAHHLQKLIHSMLVKDAGKRNDNEIGTL